MDGLGDKLNSGTRNQVEAVISDLKRAIEGENTVEIKRLSETLTHAAHRLTESMYQQAGPSAGQPRSTDSGGHAGFSGSTPDDEVVDAEYEEVR